jgi:hypothetical protein
VPANRSRVSALTPLSADDFDEVANLLADSSPLDTDGLLGVLHAVAVAPGIVPPSVWIAVVLPNGLGAFDSAGAQRCISFMLRMHNEVLVAINDRRPLVPAAETSLDVNLSQRATRRVQNSILSGSVTKERWTFVSCVASLGARRDLIPTEALAKFDALGDVKETVRRDLDAIVVAAHESLLKVRRAALPQRDPIAAAPKRKVGRNPPSPCGSGKKYKRCCNDRRHTLDSR